MTDSSGDGAASGKADHPVFKDLSAPDVNDDGDDNATEPVQVESMCVGCGENVSLLLNSLACLPIIESSGPDRDYSAGQFIYLGRISERQGNQRSRKRGNPFIDFLSQCNKGIFFLDGGGIVNHICPAECTRKKISP